MNSGQKLITILGLLFFAAIVQAGPSSGGGGGAFVCRDSSGQVSKALFLDLWESSQVYGWPVTRTNTVNFGGQLLKALRKFESLDPSFSRAVANEIIEIQNSASYLPATVIFNPPDDAKAKFSDPNCALSGMLYYDDQLDRLFVSSPIFEKLETQTDIAASWMHESIYKIARERFQATDSISSRLLVGCLFSDSVDCLQNNNLKKIFKGYTRVELCRSDDVEYYQGFSPAASPNQRLIAVKRAGDFDLSSNFAVSNDFKTSGSISLNSIGLNPWTVRWTPTGGGFWPTPGGLMIQNSLSQQYFDSSEVKCTEITL